MAAQRLLLAPEVKVYPSTCTRYIYMYIHVHVQCRVCRFGTEHVVVVVVVVDIQVFGRNIPAGVPDPVCACTYNIQDLIFFPIWELMSA